MPGQLQKCCTEQTKEGALKDCSVEVVKGVEGDAATNDDSDDFFWGGVCLWIVFLPHLTGSLF